MFTCPEKLARNEETQSILVFCFEKKLIYMYRICIILYWKKSSSCVRFLNWSDVIYAFFSVMGWWQLHQKFHCRSYSKKIESNYHIETRKRIHIHYHMRICLNICNFCRYFCCFFLFRRKPHLKQKFENVLAFVAWQSHYGIKLSLQFTLF